MDHLLYDLVEEVVSYLPRADVQTIAKVASRSPDLEKWSFAAEDQLKNRFLLDVQAHVHKKGGKEVEHVFRLSVGKCLPDERYGEWDFTQWRYAWIRNVTIRDDFRYSAGWFHEVDMQQVLRVITLPVDPSAEGYLEIDCKNRLNLAPSTEVINLSWKIMQAAQEGFASVIIRSGIPAPFEDFIVGYVGRSVFLKYLSCYWVNVAQQRRICAAVAPMFAEKGRPLKLHFYGANFVPEHIDAIVELWRNSDGTFGEKNVAWWAKSESISDSVWHQIKKKYNLILESEDSGYLAHPSRRSSLYISLSHVHMEKFQPWHVPVDLQWIESVIDDWKKGDGFYVCGEEREFSFTMAEGTTWNQIDEKYGPSHIEIRPVLENRVDSDSDSNVETRVISIPHPSNIFMVLKVMKCLKLLHIEAEHKRLSEEEVQSLISDWRKGNGETLVNGLTEIEVMVDESSKWSSRWQLDPYDTISRSYSHPLGIYRCWRSREFVSYTKWSDIECIYIVPEDVDDWNLELLFGSLQV